MTLAFARENQPVARVNPEIPARAHGRPPLRVGLITDGESISVFDAEVVRRAVAAGIAEIALVIEQDLPRQSFGGLVRRALKRGRLVRTIAFRMAVWIERRVLGIAKPEINELFSSVAIGEICDAAPLRVKPIISPSGWVHRFSADDVATIRAARLDVMLRMGSGILRGDVLTAATHGIVSFHHGDNRTNRGGPPGFWEVFEKRDYTGYIIQRLTEELDAGVVLMRGEVATRASYLRNQQHLFRCAVSGMVDLLARMKRGDASADGPDDAAIDWYSHALYTTPTLAQLAVYQFSFWRWLSGYVFARVVAARDVWELRVVQGDWKNLAVRKASALVPPRGRFWADPFVVSHPQQKAIFFEEFEFERGKAHISALVSTGGGPFTYAGPILRTPFHLSFPYVFSYAGEYYMCPEMNDGNAIQLWRCTSWPLGWEYHKTLFSNISAADTMIFEHGGRWWLFTNLDRDATGDHCRELHIYHSDSPLSDRWTPLDANPVATSARHARNAGLLVRDGKTYRLAQAQGFERYGRSLQLFEMTHLSVDGYSEKLVAGLGPARGLDATGIHHLSASGDTVVFDATRTRYFWTRMRRKPAPATATTAAPGRHPPIGLEARMAQANLRKAAQLDSMAK